MSLRVNLSSLLSLQTSRRLVNEAVDWAFLYGSPVHARRLRLLIRHRRKEQAASERRTRELRRNFVVQSSTQRGMTMRQTKDEKAVVYKGGVTFEDVFYPTLRALWEAKGVVPYNTFKTRLHRGKGLRRSLGLPENSFEYHPHIGQQPEVS